MEEEIRKKAIQRYISGENPKAIYTDLKRSKKWFFKWLKRYQMGQDDWHKDQSRAPLKRPNEISTEEKQRIISRLYMDSRLVILRDNHFGVDFF